MVKYVLSLSGAAENKKSLPASGSINATAADKGFLYLTANYTDNGGSGGSKPLTSKKTLVLRNSKVGIREVKKVDNFSNFDSAGTRYLAAPKGNGSFLVDSVDLTGITALEASYFNPISLTSGYTFELRLNDPDGQKLGEAQLTPSLSAKKTGSITIPLAGVADANLHNVYLVVRLKNPDERGRLLLQGLQFK
jgi:hypothetical protein